MHTIFTQPLAINRDGVPVEDVEKVRKRARSMAIEEGKPEQIVEKIVEGKVNAFYADRVLIEQLHVKTDDYGKAKIGDILSAAGVGGVTYFTIMRIGS